MVAARPHWPSSSPRTSLSTEWAQLTRSISTKPISRHTRAAAKSPFKTPRPLSRTLTTEHWPTKAAMPLLSALTSPTVPLWRASSADGCVSWRSTALQHRSTLLGASGTPCAIQARAHAHGAAVTWTRKSSLISSRGQVPWPTASVQPPWSLKTVLTLYSSLFSKLARRRGWTVPRKLSPRSRSNPNDWKGDCPLSWSELRDRILLVLTKLQSFMNISQGTKTSISKANVLTDLRFQSARQSSYPDILCLMLAQFETGRNELFLFTLLCAVKFMF